MDIISKTIYLDDISSHISELNAEIIKLSKSRHLLEIVRNGAIVCADDLLEVERLVLRPLRCVEENMEKIEAISAGINAYLLTINCAAMVDVLRLISGVLGREYRPIASRVCKLWEYIMRRPNEKLNARICSKTPGLFIWGMQNGSYSKYTTGSRLYNAWARSPKDEQCKKCVLLIMSPIVPDIQSRMAMMMESARNEYTEVMEILHTVDINRPSRITIIKEAIRHDKKKSIEFMVGKQKLDMDEADELIKFAIDQDNAALVDYFHRCDTTCLIM